MRRFKTLSTRYDTRREKRAGQVIDARTNATSSPLRETGARVFLNRPQRSQFFRSVRFEKWGGRADRWRCVRERRFPSDRQAVAHGFMRTVFLCLNFPLSKARHELRSTKGEATRNTCRVDAGNIRRTALRKALSAGRHAREPFWFAARGLIEKRLSIAMNGRGKKGGFSCASVSLA